jgi:hypothetical protein
MALLQSQIDELDILKKIVVEMALLLKQVDDVTITPTYLSAGNITAVNDTIEDALLYMQTIIASA